MADKGLVLITGANGFIAARTVEYFLKAGYRVRGTVRNLSSSKALQKALPEYSAQLEFVEVPEITVEGAFDKAVEGVTAICHLASPVSFSFTDPDYVINTAVNGTTSILRSTSKAGPQLKTVVVMSSIAAISEPHDGPYTYTEKDWQIWAPNEARRLGKDTPGPISYVASKTLAEKAFWAFRDENKPAFAMTAINPGFVTGPPFIPPETPDKISETVVAVWTVLSGAPIPPLLSPSASFIDNRDVARMLVWAVDHLEEANGERYITIAGSATPQAVADVLNKHYPHLNIEKGTPGEGYLPSYDYPADGEGRRVDSTKAAKATGKEWIDFETSTLDAAKVFERYLPK